MSVLGILATAVVMAALIATALIGPHQRTGRPISGAAAGAPTRSSGPATSEQAGGEPLTAAPAGVAWQLVDGVALPFSRVNGPNRVTGSIAAGFSHSPAGALLACVQIGFRLGSVNPADQAAVVRAMVIGAGQADLLASRPASVPTVKPQLAGFHYLTYTPTSAVISFAWRITDVANGTSRFISVGELQVAWSGGDWRLVDDGTPAPRPQLLDAGLTGYVAFAGA
jgi:hypothetical protein